MMKAELEADIRADRYYEWLEGQPKCRHCGEFLEKEPKYKIR